VATSGTTAFTLDVSDIMEEAYERCGLELRSGYDSKTARRSMNIMLQEWSNRGIHLWKVKKTSQALVKGTASYTLDDKIIDLLDVNSKRSGTEIAMSRLSRADYHSRPNKTTEARPSQYYLERTATPTLYVWPAPENATDTIEYYAMERLEDVGTSLKTVDVPARFLPALVSGLAYYLSMKKMPDRVTLLKSVYEEEFERAMDEDRERSSSFFVPRRGRL
jgi:hypothetical protein